MKIILSLLFVTVLLSGCVLQQEKTEYPIITEESYQVNDVLEELTFNLPQTYSEPVISLTLKLPNGKEQATFRNSFPSRTIHCSVSTQKSVILYYSGMWRVDYQIFNGTTKTIEGTYTFWVGNNSYRGLERFELESYDVNGESLSFSVLNYGKASGYVNIIIYNSNPLNGSIVEYGHEYFNQRVYLKPGYRYTNSILVSGEPVLKMKLNELDFFLQKGE
jgi:hypothetical protein